MCRTGIARSIGVVFVAFVVIALLMYLSLGSALPHPNERNRVQHLGGFSIIAPEGWLRSFSFGAFGGRGDRISLTPPKSEGRPIAIVVTRISPPDEAALAADGFIRAEIAGRSSLHRNVIKRDRVDTYIFQTGQDWFEVVTTRHKGDYADAPWNAYLKSFRIEPKKMPPTTLTSQPG